MASNGGIALEPVFGAPELDVFDCNGFSAPNSTLKALFDPLVHHWLN